MSAEHMRSDRDIGRFMQDVVDKQVAREHGRKDEQIKVGDIVLVGDPQLNRNEEYWVLEEKDGKYRVGVENQPNKEIWVDKKNVILVGGRYDTQIG